MRVFGFALMLAALLFAVAFTAHPVGEFKDASAAEPTVVEELPMPIPSPPPPSIYPSWNIQVQGPEQIAEAIDRQADIRVTVHRRVIVDRNYYRNNAPVTYSVYEWSIDYPADVEQKRFNQVYQAVQMWNGVYTNANPPRRKAVPMMPKEPDGKKKMKFEIRGSDGKILHSQIVESSGKAPDCLSCGELLSPASPGSDPDGVPWVQTRTCSNKDCDHYDKLMDVNGRLVVPKEVPDGQKCKECGGILEQLTAPDGDPAGQSKYCPNEKCELHKVLIDE